LVGCFGGEALAYSPGQGLVVAQVTINPARALPILLLIIAALAIADMVVR